MRRSSTVLAFLLAFVGVTAICQGAPVHSVIRHIKDGVTDHGDSADEKPAKVPDQEESTKNSSGGMEMSESESGPGMSSDMNSGNNSAGSAIPSAEMTESNMDSENSSPDGGDQSGGVTESDMDDEEMMDGSDGMMDGSDGMMDGSDGMVHGSNGTEMSEAGMDSHDHGTHDHGHDGDDETEGEKESDEEESHEHMSGDGGIMITESATGADGEESVADPMASPDEAEENEVAESGVCIGANMLGKFAADELVFEKHILARVLCDAGGSCATKGHIVNFRGKGMMMSSYCEIVGCEESVMNVNSPKYRRGLKIGSFSEDMHFTAFAARFETRGEEAVLSAAVHMGL